MPIQIEKEKDIDFIKITEDNIESKVNPVIKNNLGAKTPVLVLCVISKW